MDPHFERFHDEGEYTQQCIDTWFDHCCEGEVGEKRVGEAIKYFDRRRINFENERQLGICLLFLDMAPEIPQLLALRYELYQQLAIDRPDRRYLEQALIDCETRNWAGSEDQLTYVDILLGLKRYREVIDEAEDDSIYVNRLAEAYLGEGDHESCIRLLTPLIKKHSSFYGGLLRIYRGRAYDLAGQLSQRDNDWSQVRLAASRSSGGDRLSDVIHLHLMCKNFTYVAEMLQDMAGGRSAVSSDQLCFYRGLLLQRLAQDTFDESLLEESVACFQQAVQINPGYGTCWMQLFHTLERQWKYSAAIRIASECPKEDVNIEEQTGCIHESFRLQEVIDHRLPYWHGRDAMQREAYDEAWEHFHQTTRDTKGDMELAIVAARLFDLGECHSLLQAIVDARW